MGIVLAGVTGAAPASTALDSSGTRLESADTFTTGDGCTILPGLALCTAAVEVATDSATAAAGSGRGMRDDGKTGADPAVEGVALAGAPSIAG
jgi:hypothetical protein